MTSMVLSYNQSYLIKNRLAIQEDQYLFPEISILFGICFAIPFIIYALIFFAICCNLPRDTTHPMTPSSVDSDEENQDANNVLKM